MTKHIDTLAEWWENAERGAYGYGDTVIQNHHTAPDEYTVYVADEAARDSGPYVRILHRAPAPKPAWHDAVAVIAKGQEEWDHREAFTRSDDYPETRWVCNQGVTFKSEGLFDVTPLIEQKVTEAMVKRAALSLEGAGWDTSDGGIALTDALNAALGTTPA